MAINYGFQKLVQFQLLSYLADTIILGISGNHLFKYTPEEIMTNLTSQVVPMSRDFLIENATNNLLWSKAVQA